MKIFKVDAVVLEEGERTFSVDVYNVHNERIFRLVNAPEKLAKLATRAAREGSGFDMRFPAGGYMQYLGVSSAVLGHVTVEDEKRYGTPEAGGQE